jgi:hypothetical protein
MRRVHADVWCEKEDGVKTIVGSASAARAPEPGPVSRR